MTTPPSPSDEQAIEAREASDEYIDSFADFERGILQDNIALCDGKSGILLAFASAAVLFCAQSLVRPGPTDPKTLFWTINALVLLSGSGFLASSYYALLTVKPRFVVSSDDKLYWGSSIFLQSADAYVAAMRASDPHGDSEEKLRHLHALASVCRSKYRGMARSLTLSQWSFLPLLGAQLLRVFS